MAVQKAKELKVKASGITPELTKMEDELANLNTEMQNKISTYKDKISSLTDRIKVKKADSKNQMKAAQVELAELEKSILKFVVGF